MDFTPDLLAFQGVFISTDSAHPFSRLTVKGGNEEKVKYIIEHMYQFLKDRNFMNENKVLSKEHTRLIRKFILYIILNGNFKTLEKLVEKDDIDSVIWTIPTVPHYLMCELIWSFQVERFVYEIISYTYPPLAVEVTGAFIENTKYYNPLDCSQKLAKISLACYTLICRLNMFQFPEQENNTLLSETLKHFQNCTKNFVEPPNSYKLETLQKDELYIHNGSWLSSALVLLYDCLERYTKIHEKVPPDFDIIYQVTYIEASINKNIQFYNINDCPKNVLETIGNCNTILLDACQKLIMDVNVDIFCAWSEFEENGKTKQQSIGELCHKVYTKLSSIPVLCEHPIVAMLKQISRKPIEAKDVINSTDVCMIIENINKNDESWLHALLYKDDLCAYRELLDVIHPNINKYSPQECLKLYYILKQSIVNKGQTEVLAVKAFHHCDVSDKHKILTEHFVNNCFFDMKENELFTDMSTEFFNKLIATSNADITDVLTLFLQSPKKVFDKIFNLATENSQQGDIMLQVMKLLDNYCNYYYEVDTEPCIFKALQNNLEICIDTEEKENNFIRFISALKNYGILIGSKLLLLTIMPNIHKALLNKNINNINMQIKLLQSAYTIEELLEYRAPMLAMLAQVMDIVRWKIHTFVTSAPTTLQSTIELQTSFMETYGTSIPVKEENWLKSKLKNTHPLNTYYYRKIWNPPGNNFLEIITGTKMRQHSSKDDITTTLIQIICSCTQEEWFTIWDCLAHFEAKIVLDAYYEAMSLIARIERDNRTNNTWACILYCYRTLLHCTRYKFFKEPLTNNQILDVINNITRMPILCDGPKEDMEPLLLPLLAYIAERKNDYSIDLSSCDLVKYECLVTIINNIFSKK